MIHKEAFSDPARERRIFARRLIFSMFIMLVMGLTLISRYVDLQVNQFQDFVTDSDNNRVNIYNMNKKRWKTEMEIKNYQRNFSYVEQLKHFLQCVKQRKKTINDLEQGIVTLKIVLAIKKASKLMKTVNV